MLIERLQIKTKVSKFFCCSDLVWWFVYLFLVGMRKASHNGREFWELHAGFALTFQNLFLRWGCIYVLYDMSRVIISCHLLFQFSRFDWDARCMVSSGPNTCLLKVAEKFSTKGKSKRYSYTAMSHFLLWSRILYVILVYFMFALDVTVVPYRVSLCFGL